MEGKILEPIAIVGMAYRFPEGASSDDAFWKILMEGKCVSKEFPPDRMNINAFYNENSERLNRISTKKAHFLEEDISNFDAKFFGVPPHEASSMDPQHRILLETTYHALENAGIPMDAVKGTNTSVHVGCFTSDYSTYVWRDSQRIPKYCATGSAQSILSNRLSWLFDLQGISMTIDTACSSSMVALDLACKGLWSHESEMAIVGGANLIFSPELNIALSNMGFLSPDGICYSFDHRANGYARGEGFAVFVLKPLSKVAKGDTIRALIRSIGTNQDGHTMGGITQPNKDMQAKLIHDTYKKAGLDMSLTAFFEAHGTGTLVGDPIEARAIGECFGRYHSVDRPLYVGAVKSNIGHLEGTSGLAGIVKTILALEKGIIPPNANFERVNPYIDDEFFHLKFPTEAVHWPSTGIRRASVNSFGFGGSNAHVVLDGTNSHIEAMLQQSIRPINVFSNDNVANGIVTNDKLSHHEDESTFYPRLLFYSSSDEQGSTRQAHCDSKFFAALDNVRRNNMIQDFCYTRNCRRSLLAWRSYCVIQDSSGFQDLTSKLSAAVRCAKGNFNLGFIFTGQGSQWVGMGKELLQYPGFSESIIRSQSYLRALGCDWCLSDILREEAETELINEPKYSQTLTTIVQIALVDQLESMKVAPSVVIGHSSGEIAAAYCAGHISHRSALVVSFFRGELASGLFNSDVEKHTMMAIGLSAEDTTEAIQKLQYGVENAGPSFQAELITISCINSPNNVTVSGPEVQLDILEVGLGQLGIFCRRLRVGLGYHSKQMHQISSKYREQIGQLEPRAKLMSGSPIMVSSVTGEIASAKYVCTSQYWVDNMIMPVNFLGALKLCCATSREVAIVKKLNRSHTQILVTHGLLEIGPHSALKAPIHEILALNKRDQEVVYTSALARGKPAIQTFLHALGTLFCAGFDFDQESIAFLASTSHKDMSVLAGIPPYQFDHSISYWEESQRNKDFRFRYHPMHDLLGAQVEFNTLEAKWRMVIREEELSWIKEHKVNGSMLYPAAGMLVMAIEALKQLLYDKPPIAFELEEVNFMAPILLSGLAASEGVEVQTALSSLGSAGGKTNTDFHFRIFSQRTGSTFEEVCRGGIRADYGRVISDVDDGRENTERMNKSRTDFHQACNSCKYGVETSVFYESIKSNIGIEYGLAFQRLDEIRSNQQGEAVAKLQSCSLACTEHTIHPTTLDGVFQLAFAALTHGVSTEIPTMIPRRLGKLWISNAGVGHWDVREEKIHTKAHIISARSATADAAVMSVEQAELLLRIKDLELSAVSSQNVPKRSDDAEHDCYHIEWKVDLDLMTVQQVQAYCEEIRNAAIEDVAIEWADNLDLLMFSFAARCSKDLKSTDYPVLPEFQNYASWLEDRLEEHLCEKDRERLWPVLLDQDHLRSLYDKVLPNPIGKLYILVGENLARILIGEVNPLQLLFEDDNLMADFYTELIARSTALEPIRRYLDCLVHKHPNLKILEVGAGTGASTAEILNVIDDSETGSRLETYVFTDISPSFFEKARAKLVAHEDRLEFKVLNIEEDPDLQEFKGAKYDIIVADNVIHATQAISVSLLNLRKLLKPGGKLFLKEMTTPLKIITGFFSGLLPGWWRATEEYRIAQQSPVISEEKWNIVLKEAGFTGIDVAFRDFATAKCYGWTFMISTLRASESKDINDDSNKSFPVIVLDPDSAVQTHAAQYICQELGMPESPASFASLDDVLAKNSTERQGYIFLNNMNENLLWDLDATVLKCLQKLVATAHTILWVTGGGGLFSKSPKFGIAGGLLRVVRQEENKVKVVLLSLDIEQSSARLDPATLHLITTAFIVDDVEPEYMQIDNRLCINRLVTARKIDQYIFEQLEEPVVLQAIGKKELRLGVRVPGLLDTMEFVEENVTSATLGPKEVIIEVQALGINFKDCLTVLGQVDSDIIGSECAGIVRDVGANAENDFKCGDRVVACALDSYRTYLRCCTQSVAKIPAEMSFAEATSFPTAFLTALYSLVHVARLQKGESILIHAAAGGTGQAAVQMASRIGAEVFTTVGSQEKKTLLMKRYGLSEHRIFYSRDASFADGVKRATKGRGVDVVLNSVSGRLLEASWECVAPFGRFIEIGRKDVDSRGRLPMYPFIKNLTFTGVDLTMVLDMKVELGHQLLTEVMALAQSGEIKPVFPLHSFPITDVERAFRFMQSGKSSGKIVLEINQSHVVPTVMTSKPKFIAFESATYVIAGGLGGIGRRIASWLAARGAKYLILLSRTGLEGDERRLKLIDELCSQGVEVRCPRCDISNMDSLKTTLETCSDMPPIRGCFHAAMSIRDSVFSELSIANWQQCTLPKIQGSWNLHLCMPEELDFFILLSSACGIFGNAGQSSYAAGNTFLDALAQFRTARGQKSIALDLGMLLGEGYVAENEDVMARLLRMHVLLPMALEKILIMFDFYCSTSCEYSTQHSQMCSGFELPVKAKAEGMDIHTTMLRPLFRHMHQIKSSEELRIVSKSLTRNFRALFIEASTVTEARSIAAEALQHKLSRVLGLSVANIALDQHLEAYGVDSLVALELRNWMTREMGADVAIFELLGGTTLVDIGKIITSKSSLRVSN